MKEALKLAWGFVRGQIDLPADVLKQMEAMAKRHISEAAADDFCGDQVQDYVFPGCLRPRRSWLPLPALAELGFAPDPDRREELLATCGVDSHIDAINGPTFALVLHNDGLTFKQGRVSHVTKAGQWFVFDDSKPHQVRESKKSTSYIVWTMPLKRIAAPR